MPVIEVLAPPKNADHFRKLMSFARDVLALCDEIDLEPILDGSLAVFAYTRDTRMEVRDVDLNCSELDFPRLRRALESRGIFCQITDWHVLQVRRDGLKVEFGATEHWMQGIPDDYEELKIDGVRLAMVSPDGLRELYLRGLVDTKDGSDNADEAKHQRIREKLNALNAIRTSAPGGTGERQASRDGR